MTDEQEALAMANEERAAKGIGPSYALEPHVSAVDAVALRAVQERKVLMKQHSDFAQ